MTDITKNIYTKVHALQNGENTVDALRQYTTGQVAPILDMIAAKNVNQDASHKRELLNLFNEKIFGIKTAAVAKQSTTKEPTAVDAQSGSGRLTVK